MREIGALDEGSFFFALFYDEMQKIILVLPPFFSETDYVVGLGPGFLDDIQSAKFEALSQCRMIVNVLMKTTILEVFAGPGFELVWCPGGGIH